VRDALDQKRAATLDSTMRVFIGHDLFYFADGASRRRFAKHPLRYCTALTDPVTRTRFKPTRRSPRVEYEGRPYYFSSDSTRTAFQADPARFRFGRGGMVR
jgi:YHS domain-containing protein